MKDHDSKKFENKLKHTFQPNLILYVVKLSLLELEVLLIGKKILKEVFLSCNFIFLKKFACAIFMVYSFLIRKFQELVLISIKHLTPAVLQLKCCVFYFTITHLVLLNIYFIIISVPKAAILPQQVLVYTSSKAPEHFSMLSS